MMLKLKKSSKSSAPEKAKSNKSAPENPKLENKETNKQQSKPQGKFFTVKFKVEEVPIVSLFTRDYSSKGANSKAQKQNIEKSVQDERGFSKDVMQKYLKKVKPLYVRVSKRYGEKLGFSGQLSLSGAIKAGLEPPPSTTVIKSPPAEKSATESPKVSEKQPQGNVKNEKRGSIPGGLRVVRKHLGKGRSATVAAAAATSLRLLQIQVRVSGPLECLRLKWQRSEASSGVVVGASGGHPLLAPCLNGIGKFSHLINLDFMADLMNYLRKLTGGGSDSNGSLENFSKPLTVSECLQRCIVAFKVMKSNLDALNIDLQDFFA